MNHKHVMVVIEALSYTAEIDAQDAINDLCDYVEHVEAGTDDRHYESCVLNREVMTV